MPATSTPDRRSARNNSARRSNELIGRAAKHARWAGAALDSAARDLDGTWGADGNALSGLVEVVQDEATRVSSLAEEIRSRSSHATEVGPDPSRPSRQQRDQPRRGRIIDAIGLVLREHDAPLNTREVHVRVEALLDEPVRWASVKGTLASNARGPAPRFLRVARGRYAAPVCQ